MSAFTRAQLSSADILASYSRSDDSKVARSLCTLSTTAGNRAGYRCAKRRRIVQAFCICTAANISRDGNEKVNVLVVGGGGREHALAWKLAQSPLCGTLYCSPGNAGIALEDAVTVEKGLKLDDHKAVVEWCKANSIGLVTIGPEAPLVDGLADSLRSCGVRVFGPSAAAAQLEGSKAFMKELCKKHGIPTATYEEFTDPAAAKAHIRQQSLPIVIKANGLAAGKGVIIAESLEQADAAVDEMLIGNAFGEAGQRVIVEEFLDGEEASYFALIDGNNYLPLASAQDHKKVGEGDTGPNTGGMGAYSPAAVVTPDVEAQVLRDIIGRTAEAMVAEGSPYSGVLFAGLMIKEGKAKLLEHNVRFGDPECQVLMMRLQSDLLPVLLATAEGKLDGLQLTWRNQAALTVVMAAKGYPGSYQKGTPIHGLNTVSNAKVFHAGTSNDAQGAIVASGGRVLAVTALGADIADAQSKAYQAVKQIDWKDGFFRQDIGWRATGAVHH